MDTYLRHTYYTLDNPASLGGIEALYRQVKEDEKKLSRKQSKTWLQSQDDYTLHN